MVTMTGVSFAMSPFKPHEERGPKAEQMIEKMAKDIGLSQEQKEKFLAGAKKIEAAEKENRGKNKELSDKIEKELIKESPDSKIIYGYMQQISQNMTQIQFMRMEQIIQLRKELTPEQKSKMDQLMQAKKEQASKQRAIMHGKWEKPSSER